MSYYCFIDGEEFPVPPDKLPVKVKGRNETLDLVNDGEVSFLKAAGLSEAKVKLLLPMYPGYSFASYPNGFRRPDHYLNKLDALMAGKRPFQFVLSRWAASGALLYKTNITVSLEDYEAVEDAKSGPDVTVTLSLKEYRDFGTKRLITQPQGLHGTAPAVAVEKTRSAGTAPTVKQYTVIKGDTLWGIAKKQYGDGGKHMAIYNANTGVLKDPNKIYVGQVLTIP